MFPSLISFSLLGAPLPTPTINLIQMDLKLRSMFLVTLAAEAILYLSFGRYVMIMIVELFKLIYLHWSSFGGIEQ